ncbi:MAG: VWA domain-containing protein [Candidatus Kaiserbacteria bacterium]|nr:VWA domain-containing protein [Candidatus Kaiserbacteria bacterium]
MHVKFEKFVAGKDKNKDSFDGKNEEVAEKTVEQKKGESPELQEMREVVGGFLEKNKRMLNEFAGGDVKFNIEGGGGFFFNLMDKEVTLDHEWFHEQGYSEGEMLWVTLHELSHYRDFTESPEDVLRYNVDHGIERAREIGDHMLGILEEKFGDTHPDAVEKCKKEIPVGTKGGRKIRSIDQGGMKAYSTFFNIFDDVFVNNQVSRRAHPYNRNTGRHRNAIVDLYRYKLFPGANYADLPRHFQFLYALLREEMVPDEQVEVGDEVQEILDKRCVRWFGEEMTPRECVEKSVKKSNIYGATVKERYTALRHTLEPVFTDLLLRDLEDWEPSSPPEEGEEGGEEGEEGQEGGEEGESGESQGGEGGGEQQEGGQQGSSNPFGDPWEKEYQDHSKHSPDQYDWDEMIDEIENRAERKKEEEEEQVEKEQWDKKTPEEKQKDLAERKDRDLERENGLRNGEIEHLREMQDELEQPIQDLSEFWQTLLQVYRTIGKRRVISGRHQEGSDINIDAIVEEYPRILAGSAENARIFKKMTLEQKKISFPEEVHVRIIGDVSGSMDAQKMHILKQSIVLLVSSLNEFQKRVDWQKNEEGAIQTKVDTQVWEFAGGTQEIKSFRSEDSVDEDVKLAKMLGTLHSGGSTDDANAIKTVSSAIHTDSDCVRKIREKKMLEIVFMITDGGSNDPKEVQEEVASLHETGVIARAFQIGSVDKGERKSFHIAWNRGNETRGVLVGEDVGQLPGALSEALRSIVVDSM